MENPRYLGDGVYARFDGFQFWLSIGEHTAPPVVALEPAVIAALNKFVQQIADSENQQTQQ